MIPPRDTGQPGSSVVGRYANCCRDMVGTVVGEEYQKIITIQRNSVTSVGRRSIHLFQSQGSSYINGIGLIIDSGILTKLGELFERHGCP